MARKDPVPIIGSSSTRRQICGVLQCCSPTPWQGAVLPHGVAEPGANCVGVPRVPRVPRATGILRCDTRVLLPARRHWQATFGFKNKSLPWMFLNLSLVYSDSQLIRETCDCRNMLHIFTVTDVLSLISLVFSGGPTLSAFLPGDVASTLPSPF